MLRAGTKNGVAVVFYFYVYVTRLHRARQGTSAVHDTFPALASTQTVLSETGARLPSYAWTRRVHGAMVVGRQSSSTILDLNQGRNQGGG